MGYPLDPPIKFFILFVLKMEQFGAVFKLDLKEETRTQLQGGDNCLLLPHTGYTMITPSYHSESMIRQITTDNPLQILINFADTWPMPCCTETAKCTYTPHKVLKEISLRTVIVREIYLNQSLQLQTFVTSLY